MPTSDTRDQTFKMGAGEKVASSGKEVKNGNLFDTFASTPLKHTACNKQWLVETRKNFSGTDLILMIVSLITYVLDTVTGKQLLSTESELSVMFNLKWPKLFQAFSVNFTLIFFMSVFIQSFHISTCINYAY